MVRIITSSFERVIKTVSEAYQSSTDTHWIVEEIVLNSNQNGEMLRRVKKNTYNNLLWFWVWWLKVEIEYKKILQEMKDRQEYKDLSELDIQDKACILFLQWKLKTGNPYTVSQERLKLLLKWFDKLDNQNEVKMIAMRHGHREGENLTEIGIQEAKEAGEMFNFWSQDMIIGTHQTIIESLLISLIWWSKSLSPEKAWDALYPSWQQPYKTAQVTEFVFSKGKDWIKILTITTNNYTEIFNENACKDAYKFISKDSSEKKV